MINLFYCENFIFIALILSIISVFYDVRVNNLFNLDMIFIMFFLTLGVMVKPTKKRWQK